MANDKQERTNINPQELLTLATAAAGPRADGEYLTTYKQRLLEASMDMFDVRLLQDIDRIAQAQPLLGIVNSVEETDHSFTIEFLRISGNDEEQRGKPETVRTLYKEPAARIVAERARALIGHKVRWFKYDEPNKTGWKDPKTGVVPQSFRTIVGMVDLGVATADDVPDGIALPKPASGNRQQRSRPTQQRRDARPQQAQEPQQPPAPTPADAPSPPDEPATSADSGVEEQREQLLDDPLEFARWLSSRFDNMDFDDVAAVAKANSIKSKQATPTDLAKLEQLVTLESEQRQKAPANT